MFNNVLSWRRIAWIVRIARVLGVALWCSAATSAYGTDWINAAGGTFSTPANWAGGVVPGAAGGANFDIGNASYSVTFTNNPTNTFAIVGDDSVTLNFTSGTIYTADAITVGNNTGDIAALRVNTGTLRGQNCNVSDNSGAQARLTLDAGATLDLSLTLNVALAGTATFIVNNSDVNTHFSSFAGTVGAVAVGSLSGAIWTMTDGTLGIGGSHNTSGGTATITFNSSTLTQSAGGVRIWSGGHLSMLGQSAITCTDDFIIENGGELSFASGTITMSGSNALFRPNSGSFSFGQLTPTVVPTLKLLSGADATFTTSWSIGSGLNTQARMFIDGAGSTLAGVGTNSDLIVGDFNSIGTLSVTNGGTVGVSDDLIVGAGSSGDGTLIINGTNATAVRANGAASQITIGSSGAGTFSITGGARLETTGDFVLASGASSRGNGTLTSNIIGDESNLVIGGGLYIGGTATTAGGSGTLAIGINSIVNVTGPTKVYAGDVLVMNGGANPSVLNTTQIDVIGGALSVGNSTPANLNVTGNVINISGAGSFISQQYDAIGDTITVTDAGSLWTQTNRLAIQNASRLNVNNGGRATAPSMTIGDVGAGTLSVTGGGDVDMTGTFTVGGNGNGNGTVTIDGAASNISAGTLDVANTITSNSRITISNGGLLLTPIANVGRAGVAVLTMNGSTSRWVGSTINIGGTSSAAGGTATVQLNGGTMQTAGLTIWNNGRLNYNGGTLSVSTILLLGGGDIVLPAGANTHLRTNFLSIHVAGGSVADVNDNTMQSTGGMTYDQVTNLIALARNGGSWDGGGITSTSAKNHVPKNTTLGALTGAQYLFINGPAATFEGFAVGSPDVLVKYTYYGDTDLNGIVNFDDYARIDGGFNNGGNEWFEGDFNYDDVVNFDDYALIDLAFNTQGGALSVNTFDAVPEPSTIGVTGIVGLSCVMMRRRRSE